MLLSILSLYLPGISLLLFLTVVAEEGIGRWLFYQAYKLPFLGRGIGWGEPHSGETHP
jgi:hypothetical protein